VRAARAVRAGLADRAGLATAVMLAERGAKVVLGARGLDRLEALARRIAGAGGEVGFAGSHQSSISLGADPFANT
jgi:short-subunit dehydrogenase